MNVLYVTFTEHVSFNIRKDKKMSAGDVFWVWKEFIEHVSLENDNGSIHPISSSNINETLSDKLVNGIVHESWHLL